MSEALLVLVLVASVAYGEVLRRRLSRLASEVAYLRRALDLHMAGKEPAGGGPEFTDSHDILR